MYVVHTNASTSMQIWGKILGFNKPLLTCEKIEIAARARMYAYNVFIEYTKYYYYFKWQVCFRFMSKSMVPNQFVMYTFLSYKISDRSYCNWKKLFFNYVEVVAQKKRILNWSHSRKREYFRSYQATKRRKFQSVYLN